MYKKQPKAVSLIIIARLGLTLVLLTIALSAILVPRAVAIPSAAAPSATTGAATGVGATTATLNGTVNAGGESTTVTFEYGLDTSYGSTWTADQSPVTGTTATAVSATISELEPNTLYHYRVVAQNASATTYGADMTFTTLPSPPSVSTDPATAVGTTTATLNGAVNARGSSTTVTFEYGLTTAYGTTVTADQSPVTGDTATAVSKAITGLTSDTTYHFRVVAQNAGGTTYGADMTFVTTASPAPPTATTNAATGVGSSSATLNGTVNAQGSGTAVTFEYGLDTSYGTAVTAAPSPVFGTTDTAVSTAISELVPNTTYHYRVVAQNAGGTTYGADMTFTTLPLPPSATTDPPTAVGTTTATLNGTVNAQGSSTTVTFQYGLDTSYGTTVTAAQSPVTGSSNTAVSRAITGLTNGITYHYRVVAQNAGGTTYGADMTFTTGSTPPSVTTNAATGVGTTAATLNGTVNAHSSSTAVTFEYGPTTAYGRVVAADQSPVTGTTAIAVSKAISDLTPNTTYHFRAVGVNAGGAVYGADMTFTTNAAPSATTDAATGVGTTGATLNGTVNAHNDSTTVTFQYGTTTAYGTTVTADQSPVTGGIDTAVSKAITGLTPNTTYHFRVAAQNSFGTTYGADMTFYTSAPAAPTAATDAASFVLSDGATLNGTVNAHNASTTVTFEYGLDTSYGTTVTADQSPLSGATDTAVSRAITGLTYNTTYHYRVVAVNAFGTTNGTDMTFTTNYAPSAITGAASSVGAMGATLNGTVNANSLSANVTFQYGTTIAYGTTVTADQSPVSGSSNTAVSKAITGLTPNTTYHFRVVAQGIVIVYGADMTFTTKLAPTAVTGAATGVGTTGATLNGTVNAQGSSVTVTFECGLTTSYGRETVADQSPVTGATDTAVSATLADLAPNTTHHFRVVAQNDTDTIYGADMTFTTGSIPPSATTDAASSVTASGATLNGTVNAHNDSTTVTFEYGTTIAYGTTVTADQSPVSGNTNTPVSKAVSGLTSNMTYHFRVVAQNSSGTTYGADMTFTAGQAAPSATTDAASSVTASGATLNGTVNAHNDSTIVTFEYGTDTSYGREVVADQSPVSGGTDTAVSKAITGLLNNTVYHYRVVAQNAGGTTYGADVTFTAGQAAPSATTDAASSVTTSGATLNGTVNAHNDSTTVTFQYGTTIAYGTTVTADQSPVSGGTDTAVSKTIAGLLGNTTYHYRVVAQNAGGTTYGADMTFTTGVTAPAVTTQPVSDVGTTTATGNGTITSLGLPNPTAHGVVWNTTGTPTLPADDSTDEGAVSATGAFTSHMTGLSPSTTYYVRAYATNAAGTAYGNEVSFITRHHLVYLPLVRKGHISAPDLVIRNLIAATGSGVQVVIENQGNGPAIEDFWVDVYVNPDPAPTHVNQTWNDLADEGLVWGVTVDMLPGDVITLTVGDAYYVPEYSQVSWPLPAGTPVYAQVDSLALGSAYGAVLESHEISGGTYNNIAGPVVSSAVGSAMRAPSVEGLPAWDGGLPRSLEPQPTGGRPLHLGRYRCQ